MRHLAWETRSQRLTFSHYLGSQGRNHGIDIGGVQMWALPPDIFFKFSRGSDRKNKQARPSTNE